MEGAGEVILLAPELRKTLHRLRDIDMAGGALSYSPEKILETYDADRLYENAHLAGPRPGPRLLRPLALGISRSTGRRRLCDTRYRIIPASCQWIASRSNSRDRRRPSRSRIRAQ